MATISKTFKVTVVAGEYVLTADVGKEFCNLLTALNKVTSTDVVETKFRITFNLTEWIEVTKTGTTFTILTSDLLTENLTQARVNAMLSNCRSVPGQSNCGCS